MLSERENGNVPSGVANAPVTVAGATALPQRSTLAVTAGAGGDVDELAEERLLHLADLAPALALTAHGLAASAAPLAHLAGALVADPNLLLDARRDLLEGQLEA